MTDGTLTQRRLQERALWSGCFSTAYFFFSRERGRQGVGGCMYTESLHSWQCGKGESPFRCCCPSGCPSFPMPVSTKPAAHTQQHSHVPGCPEQAQPSLLKHRNFILSISLHLQRTCHSVGPMPVWPGMAWVWWALGIYLGKRYESPTASTTFGWE